MSTWNRFHYKNLTLLFISLLFAYLLSRYEPFHEFLLHLGNFGYLSVFLAGILFVSTFTVATGAVILLVLAERLSAIELGIIAGLGAVVGDFTIFRLFKNSLTSELDEIYNKIDHHHHIVKCFIQNISAGRFLLLERLLLPPLFLTKLE